MVGGQLIEAEGDKVYLAAYKPVGIVSTADPREKNNIVDFFGYPSRIYPVGRLDKDSEGLILMTSDGDIVNRILRAQGRHEKEYEVTVNKQVTPEFLERMSAGVPVLRQVTLPATLRKTGTHSFNIILVQGLNRQIRRMCEHLGFEVTRLKRVRIMHIRLGRMRPGEMRMLGEKELRALMRALEGAGPGGKGRR
jgi:23S rRNA pseudouridine2604 synthase